nr:hypothetical protein [Euzebyaceae bacterium]
ANALGLARLAAGDVDGAVEALHTAVAAQPRSLRPEGFAMAKANLAVAHERAGDAPRARLAARQALAVAEAPDAVVEQSRGVVALLGADPGDLLAVLDTEPAQLWPVALREEVVRWAAADPDERRDDARGWVEGQVARPERSEALAESWLSAVLELPRPDFDAVIATVLEATAQVDSETARRFRSQTTRAMARLPVPQLLRVRNRFNDLAVELGQEPAWS